MSIKKPVKETFLKKFKVLGLDLAEKQIYQLTDTTGKHPQNNRVLYLNADEAWEQLVELNIKGVSISLAPNLFDGTGGRKKENVIGYRYIVIDHDCEEEVQFKITPTAIIKTKRGYHYYFRIKKEDIHKLYELEKMAKKLAKIHKSDPSSGERNRAYRCSGFLHNKDPEDLFLIEPIYSSESEYSLEEIQLAYKDDLNLVEVAPPKINKSFEEWYQDMPIANGSRNSTLFIICSQGLNKGLTPEKLKYFVDDYIERSGLPKEEGQQVFEKVLKKHLLVSPEAKPKLYDIATKFLDNYKDSQGNLLLRYCKGIFYSYENGNYISKHDDFIDAKITRFIQSFDKLQDVGIKKYRADVIATIQSLCLIENDHLKSFWLSPTTNNSQLINMRNGLLDQSKYLKGEGDYLVPHTPLYFCTNQLPFDFRENATCPTWENFLNNIFEDKEVIDLLQCWFGYNLIADTSFQKFCLLYGKGANGKTVITIVLTTLLGEENVSCLGLECFDQIRTFALAGLINKLANIVGEMNEVSKTSEGLLKNIVSGELITVDRKYKEPITFRPTARLTFATNILPRITDRSDGISRRLILIPFEKQILDESLQDRRLADPKFWISSGEIGGIFLWALEGLKRLQTNGRFIIPNKVQEAINDYVYQTNPTYEYLKTTYIFSKGNKLSRNDVYANYRYWMENNGHFPLNATNFSYEVKRAFPLVIGSKELHSFNSNRHRAWIGLDHKPNDEGEQVEQLII
jgi:P4 family phage/plasmid primase-like protien